LVARNVQLVGSGSYNMPLKEGQRSGSFGRAEREIDIIKFNACHSSLISRGVYS